MKNLWKWILGILVVMVVIGALVAVPLLMHGLSRSEVLVSSGAVQKGGWNDFNQRGPMMGGGREFGFGLRHPMMGGYRFGLPFMLMGLFFRGFIPLVLLGLLVYGAYRWGKRRSNAPGSSVAAITPVGNPEVTGTTVVEPVGSLNCHKCGGVVQPDWRNCPYCGTKQ
jgi:hypothetical protein